MKGVPNSDQIPYIVIYLYQSIHQTGFIIPLFHKTPELSVKIVHFSSLFNIDFGQSVFPKSHEKQLQCQNGSSFTHRNAPTFLVNL